jgi:hypothetical protein
MCVRHEPVMVVVAYDREHPKSQDAAQREQGDRSDGNGKRQEYVHVPECARQS